MTAEDDRQARLATALRANLKRRKGAARVLPPPDPPVAGASSSKAPKDA